MKGYTEERRNAVLAKMAGPERKSIAAIAKEEGISAATLYQWRNRAREKGMLLPDQADAPEGWSSRDKFNAVLETAPLGETERADYARARGLYPEQIERWREACAGANAPDRDANRELQKQRREDRSRIRELNGEIARKDKALAETAALLTLSKKAGAIWGDGGE